MDGYYYEPFLFIVISNMLDDGGEENSLSIENNDMNPENEKEGNYLQVNTIYSNHTITTISPTVICLQVYKEQNSISIYAV